MSAVLWPASIPTSVPRETCRNDLSGGLATPVNRAFGSYAAGEFRPGSDINLLLVTETSLPFVERSGLFNDLNDLFPRLDILVYRPDELSALLESPVGFWKSVAASMTEIPLQAGH